MIVKITRDFTDKYTLEKIKAKRELEVTQERGIELISKGFARLVSDDDYIPADVSEVEKALSEKNSIIEELQNQIKILTEQSNIPADVSEVELTRFTDEELIEYAKSKNIRLGQTKDRDIIIEKIKNAGG